MAAVRPELPFERVAEFLRSHVGQSVTDIQETKGGHGSQAIFFVHDGDGYVLRLSKSREGYDKDRHAYEHFRSDRLPIPRVFEVGAFDPDHFFAISGRMPGVPSDTLHPEAVQALLPQLLETLHLVHQVDVTETTRFGEFDGDGVGRAASWRQCMLGVLEDEWLDFPDLITKGALDQEFVDEVYRHIEQLAPFCPERTGGSSMATTGSTTC